MKIIKLLCLPMFFAVTNVSAQVKHDQPYVSDKYVESDVVSLAGKKGFTFSTKAGDFLFKPYSLVQTSVKFNYYDDEGIDLADQDRVANSGFEVGNAILGFSGKAFNIVTFNLAVNAAKTGSSLLQQAWFDINMRDELRVRVGKFKTPFSQAYLQAIEENGTLDNWGLTDSELYENDDGKLEHTDESLANYDKFLTIMSKYVKSVKYEKIGKQNEEETTGFVMSDGTRITGVWLSPSTCTTETSYCGDFYITTKGKKRETVGGKKSKNTFSFRLYRHKIIPTGNSNSEFRNYCLNGENYSRCTAWVIMNGNMDYLHCSDLEFNGKTKCK